MELEQFKAEVRGITPTQARFATAQPHYQSSDGYVVVSVLSVLPSSPTSTDGHLGPSATAGAIYNEGTLEGLRFDRVL